LVIADHYVVIGSGSSAYDNFYLFDIGGTKVDAIQASGVNAKEVHASGSIQGSSVTSRGLISAGGNAVIGGGAFVNGKVSAKKLQTRSGTATISSDAFTAEVTYVVLSPETTSNDDLVTINGGADGDRLIIRNASTSYTITIKSTGNIVNVDGGDITMASQYDTCILIYDGALSKWLVIGGKITP